MAELGEVEEVHVPVKGVIANIKNRLNLTLPPERRKMLTARTLCKSSRFSCGLRGFDTVPWSGLQPFPVGWISYTPRTGTWFSNTCQHLISMQIKNLLWTKDCHFKIITVSCPNLSPLSLLSLSLSPLSLSSLSLHFTHKTCLYRQVHAHYLWLQSPSHPDQESLSLGQYLHGRVVRGRGSLGNAVVEDEVW